MATTLDTSGFFDPVWNLPTQKTTILQVVCSLGWSQKETATEKKGFYSELVSIQPKTHFKIHQRETDGTGCKLMPSFPLCPRTSCRCTPDHKPSVVCYVAVCFCSVHLRHTVRIFTTASFWESKSFVILKFSFISNHYTSIDASDAF